MSTRLGKREKVLIFAGGGVVFLAVMIFTTMTRGHVKGTEFAPSHFQTRTFEFYQVPFVNFQITPIWRTSAMVPTMQYLSTQPGYLNLPQTAPRQWHLVQVSTQSSLQPFGADASLLVNVLRHADWEEWSKAHPQQAKHLWPRVQQLAERELYLLVPRVLHFARTHADDTTFAQGLEDLIIRELSVWAKDLHEAGSTEQAEQMLQEAQQLYPANARLRKALDGGAPSA